MHIDDQIINESSVDYLRQLREDVTQQIDRAIKRKLGERWCVVAYSTDENWYGFGKLLDVADRGPLTYEKAQQRARDLNETNNAWTYLVVPDTVKLAHNDQG